ncbi:MAG: hypothetical protein JXB46_02680 [Candidatus Eisenbacteria bacterium]|nr:hypothetical protein [Candidatus Eisenbacteria bacterium]
MEQIVLGIILAAAVAALVWIVLRQIRRASGRTLNPSCAGCPFEPKCEMQDRQHLEPDAVEDQHRPGSGSDAGDVNG